MRLKGFQKLTPIDEALEVFLKKVPAKKTKIVTVPLHLALNRVLAKDIVAKEDLPRFDRSAVDGYAVRAEDTLKASQFRPKTFCLVNGEEIGEKQAKKVWTGNPIPKGANAVVMLENTKQKNSEIEVWISATSSENISKRGEDIQKGKVAVEAGIRLKPQHLGIIAALGNDTVEVFEKPKIAILATGNELVEMGRKAKEDQVFEVNRLILSGLCRELDVEPLDLGIAKDEVNVISRGLKRGLATADVVLTTGGTSIGALDLVPEVVNKIGKPGVVVHGIAMRPAMPTALAVVDEKPIIVLSGNPVAAMFGFEVFARPVICRLLGLKHEELRVTVKAKMTKKVASTLGRRTFARVHVFRHNQEFLADPISTRGSGTISTITKANGYVVIPENREGLAEGESVSVHLFDNVEVEN